MYLLLVLFPWRTLSNIAPKLPSSVWKILPLKSCGKLPPTLSEKPQRNGCHQPPMQPGFWQVTQAQPVRSEVRAVEKFTWRFHLTLGSHVVVPGGTLTTGVSAGASQEHFRGGM